MAALSALCDTRVATVYVSSFRCNRKYTSIPFISYILFCVSMSSVFSILFGSCVLLRSCVDVSVTNFVLVFGEQKMVQRLQEIVSEYDDRMRKMQLVPRFSYRRGLLRKDGAPNRMFLTFLFGHQELATQFLKDVGLIPSKVQCSICQRDMTWTADLDRSGRFRWRCRKSVARVRCRGTACIRHGSWFQLTILEIIAITYDILRRNYAYQIENELNLSDHTVADWDMFCSETMLEFLEGSSQKIGGPKQIVEIDESKVGRRKYNTGHYVQGHWVFGSVERGSGRIFLFPVPDRTTDMLTALIRGITLRSFWGITPRRMITVTIWRTTCSRRAAGHREYQLSSNSCISSRAKIGHVCS